MAIHSYQSIKDLLYQFANAHLSIERYDMSFFEQLPNFATEGEQTFPLLYAVPQDVTLQENVDEFTFRVYCVDLMQKDRSNETEILNQTLLILRDLNNWLREDLNVPFSLIGDPRATPINNFLMDFTAGWFIDITIEATPDTRDCAIPFTDNFNYEVVGGDVQITSNVTVIDGITTVELGPGESYTCTVANPPSGILYQKPLPKNIVLSQRNYDEAWHYQNGTYDYTPPTNPISVAMIDMSASVPFLTLLNNNAFGNKERFTDELGTQVYANNYVIDHLTGLGWMTTVIAEDVWENHLNNANAFELTALGYSDFRLPSFGEWNTISFYDDANRTTLSYDPFDIISNDTFALCTNTFDSGRFFIAYDSYGQSLRTGFSTTNYNTMYLRTHY